MLERLDLRRLALALATAIGVLGLLGGVHALARDGGPFVRMPLFGLDEEWSVPAFFSAALLAAAAAAALADPRDGDEGARRAVRLHGHR